MLPVSPVVMVAMVFMVPMTLMERPALMVVIIVRMVPVRSLIRGPLPYSGPPHIPSAVPVPVAVDPRIPWTRHSWPHLVADRRRSNADIYADSRKGRGRECRSQDQTCYPFRFHTFSPYNLSIGANPAQGERFRSV